jgi:hypothetical protein
MPYSADISSANPTCFLFLIDQSESMLERVASGEKTKAEALADAINSLLCNLCLTCVKGREVRDRFFVGVLGYGLDVAPALVGSHVGRELIPITDVARKPLRVEQRTAAGSGTPATFPVWFDPVGQGKTPMCAALKQAKALLARFLLEHPDCFPPVVMNLTDGEATDGDPEGPAAELCRLSSRDGDVLLFNAHLSSQAGQRILFPQGEETLPDRHARLLFRMSSLLPPRLRTLAQLEGYAIGPGARGFVFNATMDMVVQFLRVGTTASRTRA